MRRDSIFYQLFSQSPAILFTLLDHPPANAEAYRFDSVAVKEPKFEIDGVFLPPDTEPPGVVFFCEIQFQKDEQLYEWLFGELFLYFYRNRSRFSDWQAVVIYPTRATEQTQTAPYRALLYSDQVHRVYLNELGPVETLPLSSALMVLTTLPDQQAVGTAHLLLSRSQQELPQPESRAIIDMLITIMVYKFTTLSRQEVEAMLGISLQQTRVYQEAKEEGRQEGRQEGQISEAIALILRLLKRRIGELSAHQRSQVQALSLAQLETLGEALLDFRNPEDLDRWLQQP